MAPDVILETFREAGAVFGWTGHLHVLLLKLGPGIYRVLTFILMFLNTTALHLITLSDLTVIFGLKVELFVGGISERFGSVVGLSLVAINIAKMKTKIPFGPFMILGAWIAYFYRDRLLEWYWNLFV